MKTGRIWLQVGSSRNEWYGKTKDGEAYGHNAAGLNGIVYPSCFSTV